MSGRHGLERVEDDYDLWDDGGWETDDGDPCPEHGEPMFSGRCDVCRAEDEAVRRDTRPEPGEGERDE